MTYHMHRCVDCGELFLRAESQCMCFGREWDMCDECRDVEISRQRDILARKMPDESYASMDGL